MLQTLAAGLDMSVKPSRVTQRLQYAYVFTDSQST